MLPYRDSLLGRAALGIFFLLVIAYAYFEARGLLFGPEITVPSEVTVVEDPFVKISGKADRISKLTMNGKSVPVTEDGLFEEPYLLAEGYNRIILRAEDKYGRSSEKVVEIIFEPESDASAAPVATSTAELDIQNE